MYVIYIYTYAIQRRKEALTHVCQISLDSHVGSAVGDFSSPWVSVAMGFSTDFVHIKKQHIHGKITGYGCLDKWIYQYFPYLGCGFIIGHIWTHLDSRSDQKKKHRNDEREIVSELLCWISSFFSGPPATLDG